MNTHISYGRFFLLTSTLIFTLLGLRPDYVLAQAFPETFTTQQKTDQRAAGDQLLNQIQAAYNGGATSFTLPANQNYRFDKKRTQGARQVFIKWTNMDNFTIDCNNSTFYFEDDCLGIYVGSCENFILKRLNIDYDPLPFTQGVITAVNGGNLTVTLEAGYRNVSPRFQSATSATDITVRGAIISASTNKFKGFQNLFTATPFMNPWKSNGVYTVAVQPFYTSNAATINAAAGDKIAFWIRGDGAVLTEGSKNVQYIQVDLYASSGLGFTECSGYGGHVYRDCNMLQRWQTNRLINCNCDAFHSSCTEVGPLIENCDVSSIGDDGVNVHGTYSKVLAYESPTSIVVEQMAFRGTLPANLTYEFIRTGDCKSLGRRQATAQLFLWNSQNGQMAHRLTLSTPITGVSVGDFSSCLQYIGKNANIRNNTFTNILTRGILFRSEDGAITDNTFSWVGMYGIALMPQPDSWKESAYNYDVAVERNNLTDVFVFRNADTRNMTRAAIYVHSPGYSLGNLQKNLTIGSNSITRTAGHGICVEGANTVTMWYNVISYYGSGLVGNGIHLKTVTGLSCGETTYSNGNPLGSNYVNLP